MTEEINHSYDGGLYAELIRNRAFLDDRNAPAFRSVVTNAVAAAPHRVAQRRPVQPALPARSVKPVAVKAVPLRNGMARSRSGGAALNLSNGGADQRDTEFERM